MKDMPEDPKLLDVLDDYLRRLQGGQTPDREGIVREHPELASALNCLDALEGLAPAGDDSLDNATLHVGGPVDEAPAIASDEFVGMNDLPRAFGQYELLSEIGRGGMGVVYKARQKSLDRVVAVKMILAGHLASPQHVRRFQAEAKAAARVPHSNIVHVHEVGQLHGQDYFVMDYIEGIGLDERIAQGPLEVEAIVRLMIAVARAADHMHQHGIVHRDLKPSNILIDVKEELQKPYLTDFGLAKSAVPEGEMTATGVIAGTPSYMAPEQAAGHSREAGPAADVYSLGAILFHLLTGQPPFQEANPLETIMDVVSREPPLPRSINRQIPRGLELICLKCLRKSPQDRYPSAAALADDLERFARGEPLAVHPPTPAQKLWSWARRKPALASRLGGLGLFFIIATFNYLAETKGVTLTYYLQITAILAVWAAASAVAQCFLGSRRWSIPARFVWGTIDSLSLLAVLLFSNGAASPLLVSYPLLIVASGLWFRVRFVSFITISSLISYGILVLDYWWIRPDRPEYQEATIGIDDHLIFAVALVVLGTMMAYLVRRVRILSAFCGHEEP